VPAIKLCVSWLVTCSRSALYHDTRITHKTCTRPPSPGTFAWASALKGLRRLKDGKNRAVLSSHAEALAEVCLALRLHSVSSDTARLHSASSGTAWQLYSPAGAGYQDTTRRCRRVTLTVTTEAILYQQEARVTGMKVGRRLTEPCRRAVRWHNDDEPRIFTLTRLYTGKNLI